MFNRFLLFFIFSICVSCTSVEKQATLIGSDFSNYGLGSRNPSSLVIGKFGYCDPEFERMLVGMKKFWNYVKNEQIDCVEIYLQEAEKRGFNLVYAQDSNEMTPIMYAAFFGNFEMLCMLLNYTPYGDPKINLTDKNGKSALHHSVQGRSGIDKLIAKILLLDAGIDPGIPDNNGNSALNYAQHFIRGLMNKTGDVEFTMIENRTSADDQESDGKIGGAHRSKRDGYAQVADVILSHKKIAIFLMGLIVMYPIVMLVHFVGTYL